MQFDKSIEKFTLAVAGRTVCQPCLNLAFFAPILTGPANFTGPFDAFVRRFDSQLEWYRDDGDQMHARRIPPDRRAAWFAKTRTQLENAIEGVSIEIRAASEIDEWKPPTFNIRSTRVPKSDMSLQITLPVSWLDNHGIDGLECFVDDLAGADFNFTFGYIGLGLSWNQSSVADPSILYPLFYEWLKLHPGLTSSAPLAQKFPARDGLVDIGWITLLGREYAYLAGGANGIRSRIDPAHERHVKIRTLPGEGLAIRSGDYPLLGDVCYGNLLDIQGAVGRALRSLWNAEKNKFQVIPGFASTDDFTERGKWANRFFE